jgi:hypothetical protein
VHARAEIDEPSRPINESDEHVSRQHVDRERELVAVLAGLPGQAAEADTGVVDDRVVGADAVACSATERVCSSDARSPITTVGAPPQSRRKSAARSSLRTWSVTSWPACKSSRPDISLMPSLDPVTRTLAITKRSRCSGQAPRLGPPTVRPAQPHPPT